MQFKIFSKLLVLVLLPLSLISIMLIIDIVEEDKLTQKFLVDKINLELFHASEQLLEVLQNERDISYYVKKKKATLETLTQARLKTDTFIKELQTLYLKVQKQGYTFNSNIHVDGIIKDSEYITQMRDSIDDVNLERYLIYDYFDTLNYKILLFLNNFELLNSQKIFALNITKNIVQYRQLAREEKSHSAFLLNFSSHDEDNFFYFNTLTNAQEKKLLDIEYLFSQQLDKKFLHELRQTYENKTLDDMRDNIILRELDIVSEVEFNTWLLASETRIEQINKLKMFFFQKASNNLETMILETNMKFIYTVIMYLFLIILLFIATYFMAYSIKTSVRNLELGLKEFFNYLNFQGEKPARIEVTSDDEIGSIIKGINEQIDDTGKRIEEDLIFIDEVTGILSLMKRGDFTERVYFEPISPSLIELKDVFNGFMLLISGKIKEQTLSLELVNSDLEKRVHEQTMELEEQLKIVMRSRDKAIEAEIAKDEFLANMSHEIRTPLNAILGFVSILKKTTVEPKSLNYLNIIFSSGQSLLRIINDILDFSKIRSGKFVITKHTVNIMNEMNNTALLFASKAYEKHILFAIYIDPKMPSLIKLDDVRVKQILSNILSNAIKFTPEDGTVELDITCNNSMLVIKVKDSGIGIAQENISQIFNAFAQADSSTTRKYGGTGLGLAISNNLANLMGGKLSVSSEVSLGSIFTLSVPVEIIEGKENKFLDTNCDNLKIAILNNQGHRMRESLLKKYLLDFGIKHIDLIDTYDSESAYDILFFTPDDEYNEEIVESNRPAIAVLRNVSIKLATHDHIKPLYAPYTPLKIKEAILELDMGYCTYEKLDTKKREKENEDSLSQFQGKILVAEDNKTNQMLISLLLDDFSVDYKIAKDGLEAFKMFKEDNFDLVLMDENMPNLNGIGAMKKIREYEAQGQTVFTPVIALTASVLETDKEKFIKAGMEGFVGKPINVKELESELANFLIKV